MLALDAGNMLLHNVPDILRPEYLQVTAAAFAEALGLMGYAAAGLGGVDAHLPAAVLRGFAAQAPFPVLSANLRDGAGEAPFPATAVLELPGGAVGVFALTAAAPLPGAPSLPELSVVDPLAAARAAVERLRPRCRLLVALSSLGLAEDMRLAREVPGIDVILGSGARTMTSRAQETGSTLIVHAGSKGMRLGRLEVALAPGAAGRWADRATDPAAPKAYAWSLVPLDKSIPDDPAVAAVLERLRGELRERDLEVEVATAAAAPAPAAASPYTGAAACGTCHPEAVAWWSETPHARAFATLERRRQDANRDCLPCHVTAYGEPGGWRRDPGGGAPPLDGVQCEACHGFGRDHRGPGRIRSGVPEPVCRRCHTVENSPTFRYETYLRQLAPHAGTRPGGAPPAR